MIAETRDKLLAAARHAFGTVGYADASMDEFTAEAGLTRGALYHHFGAKKGLLLAVIMQIDAEMTARLKAVSSRAPTRWQGFVAECTCYLEQALEPEVQRIMLRDGPAVLGDPSQWPNASGCISGMAASLTQLKADGVVKDIDPEAAALLISGASLQAAQWIANAPDPQATSHEAIKALTAMLEGLRASK